VNFVVSQPTYPRAVMCNSFRKRACLIFGTRTKYIYNHIEFMDPYFPVYKVTGGLPEKSFLGKGGGTTWTPPKPPTATRSRGRKRTRRACSTSASTCRVTGRRPSPTAPRLAVTAGTAASPRPTLRPWLIGAPCGLLLSPTRQPRSASSSISCPLLNG